LFSVDRSSVRDLFADLGHFALSRFSALADDDKQRLESTVGKLFLNAREGIAAIGAERAADNSISQDRLPPVIPRDLRSLPHREFNSIVLKQAQRLAHSGRVELCIDLEREFKEFKCANQDDTAFREELEIQPSIVSFADGWRPLEVRFSTAAVLIEWFAAFGVAQKWVSDQGSHFKNTVMANIQKQLGTTTISLRLTVRGRMVQSKLSVSKP
jgi:hypothetical protein